MLLVLIYVRSEVFAFVQRLGICLSRARLMWTLIRYIFRLHKVFRPLNFGVYCRRLKVYASVVSGSVASH
jgi:hypothetical protein